MGFRKPWLLRNCKKKEKKLRVNLDVKSWKCKPQISQSAAVAQLDRASDYGSEGLGFESLQLHHFSLTKICSAGFFVSRKIKWRARTLF